MSQGRVARRAAAQWIRPADTRYATGEWHCYRHLFSLRRTPNTMPLRIAADSKHVGTSRGGLNPALMTMTGRKPLRAGCPPVHPGGHWWTGRCRSSDSATRSRATRQLTSTETFIGHRSDSVRTSTHI